LEQQFIFGTPPQLPIQEDDFDSRPLKFIHEQDLVGILPRQPIWRVHVETLHAPGRHQIPQPLHAGSY
jgi:hypothetical protein